MLENDPREIINPLFIDTVVSGSATILTDNENCPGKIILKVQAFTPPKTSPHTFLFPLEKSDAQQLHEALSHCLRGTSN